MRAWWIVLTLVSLDEHRSEQTKALGQSKHQFGPCLAQTSAVQRKTGNGSDGALTAISLNTVMSARRYGVERVINPTILEKTTLWWNYSVEENHIKQTGLYPPSHPVFATKPTYIFRSRFSFALSSSWIQDAFTCLSVSVSLVGRDSSQRHGKHLNATEVLCGVDDVSVVHPVYGQHRGASVLGDPEGVPVAIRNIRFRNTSLHLPSNTCVWRKVHFAVLNLEDSLKTIHRSNIISLSKKRCI